MYKIIIKKESALQISVLLAGFTTLVVQVVFLREFLNILYGNELVSGMILANWMVLTAAGAFLGGKFPGRGNHAGFIIAGQTAMALLPALSLLTMYGGKAVFFPPGVLPGFWSSWLFLAAVMTPFCLVSGAMFALYVKAYSRLQIKSMATEVYSLEAAGAVVAGLIFTFLLIRIFNAFEILVMIAAANIAAALSIVLAWDKSRMLFHGLLITLLMWVAANAVVGPERTVKSWMYPGQRIRLSEETPFGSLLITERSGQLNFFENGIALFSGGEPVRYEESVHYAMLQHPAPQKVLLVSGGLSGAAPELLKYPVSEIHYVEINPALIKAERRLMGWPDDPRLRIIINDPAKYLQQTKEKYDVILLNLPPPANLQLNRFYSLEFFTRIRHRLQTEGIVSVSMGGGSNYLGGQNLRYYSIIAKTLREVFSNLLLVPGESSNYLLASERPLTYEYAGRLESLQLDNRFVNRYYISDELLQMRGLQIMEQLAASVPVNHDFRPAAFFTRIGYWLSWYDVRIEWVMIPALLGFLLLIIFLPRADKGMFVAGFTASSVEILLLLIFQVMYGFMYQALALLFGVFMCGLAVGAWISRYLVPVPRMKTFAVNQLLVGMVALAAPAIGWVHQAEGIIQPAAAPAIYLIMLLSGMITGLHFAMAWQLKPAQVNSAAAFTYGFDLLGSAAGALIIAVFLVPVFGLNGSAVLLFSLNLFTAVMLIIRKKRVRGRV
ncbi:MAG: hypothetical protein ACLFPE_02015 [Bacteroidales bacterium]